MATITCPTCSQNDFENAYYNLSSPGDTIVLPAGSATWGNSGRANAGVIYIITNVTVQGQGDTTIITLDDTGKTYAQGVIALWAAATFKDMKILGSSAAPVTAFHVASYNNTTTGVNFTGGFRVSNITYTGGTGGSADAYFGFIQEGVISGLFDNCRLTGNSAGAELILARGPSDAWTTSSTLGGANNIFIEDCTYNNVGYVCDANSNGRLVARFNTINGSNKVDAHGVASNTPPRSFRHIESYYNTWTGGGSSATAIEVRGGTAMVFNNTSSLVGSGDRFYLHDYMYDSSPKPFGSLGQTATLTHGTPTTLVTPLAHGFTTGWHVWCEAPLGTVYGSYAVTVINSTTFTISVTTTVDETANFIGRYYTPYDYPIKDQVGVGTDPKSAASAPAYVFGNVKNGSAWARTYGNVCTDAITLYRDQTGNGSATFTDSDVIQSNRDFFADAGFDTNTGVQIGTASAMAAYTPSVTGYGWWVTDEGSWRAGYTNTSGRLYKWSGSAWVLYYTPYTYPHPLRASSNIVRTGFRLHTV